MRCEYCQQDRCQSNTANCPGCGIQICSKCVFTFTFECFDCHITRDVCELCKTYVFDEVCGGEPVKTCECREETCSFCGTRGMCRFMDVPMCKYGCVSDRRPRFMQDDRTLGVCKACDAGGSLDWDTLIARHTSGIWRCSICHEFLCQTHEVTHPLSRQTYCNECTKNIPESLCW